MDLDTKDHSLEIAALRTQSAISESWTFKFEELPPTVRHRIYRELLLMPKKWDSERDASYLSEHEKLSESIEGLVVEFGEDNHEMHPQIMRTNKRIHEEAAAVLYGENWFTWSTYGYEFMPIFHEFQRETTQCPRHYSRLITRVDLSVNVKGAGNTQTIPEMFFWLTTNLKHACKVLTLSDLKILKVDFYNSLAWEFGGSAHSGYFGERCLEPLKKCRAEKFLVNRYASPRYAAELKAVIEGPRDASFQTYRRATEEEPGSDFDELEESDLEDAKDEDAMDDVQGAS